LGSPHGFLHPKKFFGEKKLYFLSAKKKEKIFVEFIFTPDSLLSF